MRVRPFSAGKSSAINALTDNKKLARTSKTPGRTQLLNFFSLDGERRLVDLPGYGYAKVPEAMKLKWQRHLNEYLQERINPDGGVWGGWKFRTGDLVMNTKNNMYKSALGGSEHYVANGEQGVVIELTDRHAIVRFQYPDRDVRFTKNDPVVLAFAITVHKSQGSEWPVTYTVLDGGNFMGTREIVTTSISRAKDYAIAIGKSGDLRKWCGKSGVTKRKTFLVERCKEMSSRWSKK